MRARFSKRAHGATVCGGVEGGSWASGTGGRFSGPLRMCGCDGVLGVEDRGPRERKRDADGWTAVLGHLARGGAPFAAGCF